MSHDRRRHRPRVGARLQPGSVPEPTRVSGGTVSGTWRSARRRILTPNVSETRLDVRGFHAKSDAATELLESVGRTFLEGFAAVAQARGPVQAQPELEAVPPQL